MNNKIIYMTITVHYCDKKYLKPNIHILDHMQLNTQIHV